MSKDVSKRRPKQCEGKKEQGKKKVTCCADKRKAPSQYPTKPRQRKPKESDNRSKRFCFGEEADCECMMCGEIYANSRPGEQGYNA